jgi:hypothetical protein
MKADQIVVTPNSTQRTRPKSVNIVNNIHSKFDRTDMVRVNEIVSTT